MTIDTLHIRPATAADAPALAELIDIAGEGIPTWVWARSAGPGESPAKVGSARAARETGGFSYRNCLVASDERGIAGMLLGYRIEEPGPAERAEVADLPAPIRPMVELEHEAVGSFYVNALAVRADTRGRGIGSGLLGAAEAKARALGAPHMSIQVFAHNSGALRLYGRRGYRIVARRPLTMHPGRPGFRGEILLMTKPSAA